MPDTCQGDEIACAGTSTLSSLIGLQMFALFPFSLCNHPPRCSHLDLRKVFLLASLRSLAGVYTFSTY